jgi:DNA-binding transcriptional regulator PaaX
VQELIEAIGESGPAVRMALSRLGKQGLIVNSERGVWKLSGSL